MLQQLLFDATPLPLLEKGLDAYATRHRTISDNVANAETPGYRRRVVRFEDNLQKAIIERRMSGSDRRHLYSEDELSAMNPEVVRDDSPTDVSGVNNVDIDREMTDLAQNTIQFTTAAHIAKMQFELINQSIKGI